MQAAGPSWPGRDPAANRVPGTDTFQRIENVLRTPLLPLPPSHRQRTADGGPPVQIFLPPPRGGSPRSGRPPPPRGGDRLWRRGEQPPLERAGGGPVPSAPCPCEPAPP